MEFIRCFQLYLMNNDLVTGSTGLPVGWYYKEMQRNAEFSVRRNVEWEAPSVIWGDLFLLDYDQYFVDEFNMIDFLDLKATAICEPPTLNPAVSSRGNCMIFKMGFRTEKCGIPQNVFITDTIYEIKYSKPILRYITPLEIVYNDYDGIKFGFEGGSYGSNLLKIISSLSPNV